MWVYAAFIIWILRSFYKTGSTQLQTNYLHLSFGLTIFSKYPILDVSVRSFYNMGSTQLL